MEISKDIKYSFKMTVAHTSVIFVLFNKCVVTVRTANNGISIRMMQDQHY